MARRGDGIGIDVTEGYVRAVRLAHDTPGRAVDMIDLPRRPRDEGDGDVDGVDVPAGRRDSHVELVELFAHLVARLGDVDDVPTRLSWFPAGSTLQASDVTGMSDGDIDARRTQLADHGIGVTALARSDDRARLLGFRWDADEARAVAELARVAGFHEPGIEPAPMALARVVPRGLCAAEVMIGRRRGWSVLLADRVPLLAATNTPGSLTSEEPALVLAEVDRAAIRQHRQQLGSSLTTDQLAEVLGELTVNGARLRSRWVAAGEGDTVEIGDDTSGDVDVGNHAVALGAAIAAAGLMRAPLPRALANEMDGGTDVDDCPWVVERLADPPPPPERPSWWRRLAGALRRWMSRRTR